MSIKKSFLVSKGFDVSQTDVYHVLRNCDKKPALQAIWESQIEGWFHYKEDMINLGICTEEEWKAKRCFRKSQING